MTIEQLNALKSPIQSEISKLRKLLWEQQAKIRDLENQYLAELPIKVGDKVHYVHPKFNDNSEMIDEGVLYVMKMEWRYGNVDITLSRPKKDGTMSSKSAGFYNIKMSELTKVD